LLAPQKGLFASDPKTSAPEADLHPATFCSRTAIARSAHWRTMQGKPRLPEMSNFYCLPGRAGGSPNVLAPIYSDLREAISIENRYFTSDLTSLP
jgi:hypothetical protein